jgi:cytochrome c oxidase subunit 2
MNTVPGMVTRFKFIPNKTTAEMRVERAQEDFNFILMCNKICGGAHYKMKMMVVVMEEEDYNKWWDVKKTMTFKSKYFASEEPAEEPATEAAAPAEEAAQADTTATAMN